MNNEIRKLPVHMPPIWKNGRSPLIFLTVCTNGRRKILASHFSHKTLRSIWADQTNSAAWLVGKYVIMLDHIHLFCAPRLESVSLEAWVKFWKKKFSIRMAEKGFLINKKFPLFQKSFWDTQMRNQDHYCSQWEYVEQNPKRAELVNNSDDWKFKGEINKLEY